MNQPRSLLSSFVIVILFFLFSFIFAPVKVFAWKSIVIERVDQDDIRLNLSDDLELSFSPSHLIITGDKVNMEIPKSNLKNFFVDDILNDFPTLVKDTDANENIVVDSIGVFLSSPGDIYVYSTDGKLVLSRQKCKVLEFASLSPSVYLIVVNGISFKIIK